MAATISLEVGKAAGVIHNLLPFCSLQLKAIPPVHDNRIVCVAYLDHSEHGGQVHHTLILWVRTVLRGLHILSILSLANINRAGK